MSPSLQFSTLLVPSPTTPPSLFSPSSSIFNDSIGRCGCIQSFHSSHHHRNEDDKQKGDTNQNQTNKHKNQQNSSSSSPLVPMIAQPSQSSDSKNPGSKLSARLLSCVSNSTVCSSSTSSSPVFSPSSGPCISTTTSSYMSDVDSLLLSQSPFSSATLSNLCKHQERLKRLCCLTLLHLSHHSAPSPSSGSPNLAVAVPNFTEPVPNLTVTVPNFTGPVSNFAPIVVSPSFPLEPSLLHLHTVADRISDFQRKDKDGGEKERGEEECVERERDEGVNEKNKEGEEEWRLEHDVDPLTDITKDGEVMSDKKDRDDGDSFESTKKLQLSLLSLLDGEDGRKKKELEREYRCAERDAENNYYSNSNNDENVIGLDDRKLDGNYTDEEIKDTIEGKLLEGFEFIDVCSSDPASKCQSKIESKYETEGKSKEELEDRDDDNDNIGMFKSMVKRMPNNELTSILYRSSPILKYKFQKVYKKLLQLGRCSSPAIGSDSQPNSSEEMDPFDASQPTSNKICSNSSEEDSPSSPVTESNKLLSCDVTNDNSTSSLSAKSSPSSISNLHSRNNKAAKVTQSCPRCKHITHGSLQDRVLSIKSLLHNNTYCFGHRIKFSTAHSTNINALIIDPTHPTPTNLLTMPSSNATTSSSLLTSSPNAPSSHPFLPNTASSPPSSTSVSSLFNDRPLIPSHSPKRPLKSSLSLKLRNVNTTATPLPSAPNLTAASLPPINSKLSPLSPSSVRSAQNDFALQQRSGSKGREGGGGRGRGKSVRFHAYLEVYRYTR